MNLFAQTAGKSMNPKEMAPIECQDSRGFLDSARTLFHTEPSHPYPSPNDAWNVHQFPSKDALRDRIKKERCLKPNQRQIWFSPCTDSCDVERPDYIENIS